MSNELFFPVLAACLAAGFVVESMIGFGSAMISLSLASLFWPVQRIIPIQVATGLPMSAYIALRYRKDIAADRLGKSYLPFTLPGIFVGMALAGVIPNVAADRLFGGIVLVLTALQLPRMFSTEGTQPMKGLARNAALIGAGVMHGIYAIGGPLMVLVAGRERFSKGTFRATLSALWLVLGLILVVQFVSTGRYVAADAPMIALLLIPVALSIWLGDWLHSRVPEGPFRAFAMGLLVLVAGKLAFSRGTP